MNESLPSSAQLTQSGIVDAPEPDMPQVRLPFQKPVYLVGMMGAGKTTIGRALARKLGWQFVDLDHELEARCGVKVSIIFDIEGEQGFRKRESMLLDECTRRSGIVLATGGGAVLDPQNRQYLKERGVVVYLRASVDELFRRVERDRNRPLLQTDNPRQRLQELVQQREPLYHEVADLVFDTGNLPIAQTTRVLIRQLMSFSNSDTSNTDDDDSDRAPAQARGTSSDD